MLCVVVQAVRVLVENYLMKSAHEEFSNFRIFFVSTFMPCESRYISIWSHPHGLGVQESKVLGEVAARFSYESLTLIIRDSTAFSNIFLKP